MWIQYQNLLLNHNPTHCTINDDVFCVWVFWSSFELAQVWPSSDKKLSKMYKYKNITEAKYKNNKIQKQNYEMFCGWSELTQVWPPSDKKYKRNYQNKKYLKSKITKILTIQLRDVLWLVWADSGLTTRWLEWPGSKSAAATKIPNHLPYSKLKLLNFLRFQIASNFSDIFLIFSLILEWSY